MATIIDDNDKFMASKDWVCPYYLQNEDKNWVNRLKILTDEITTNVMVQVCF